MFAIYFDFSRDMNIWMYSPNHTIYHTSLSDVVVQKEERKEKRIMLHWKANNIMYVMRVPLNSILDRMHGGWLDGDENDAMENSIKWMCSS